MSNDNRIILELLETCSSSEQVELLKRFLRIIEELHDNKLRKHNRSLPISEYFVDRWQRASALGFGDKSSIYDSATVIGDVSVGSSTWIGPNVMLDGSGGLEIGSNCSISANAQIYTHDSVKWATSGGTEKYEYAKTRIGNNCYIGPNVIISKGVTIEDGCVVGANSFVNQSIEAGAKAAGNPAKIIGRV